MQADDTALNIPTSGAGLDPSDLRQAPPHIMDSGPKRTPRRPERPVLFEAKTRPLSPAAGKEPTIGDDNHRRYARQGQTPWQWPRS
eukprot:11595174-Alexandrium_andersonii.AAC.1